MMAVEIALGVEGLSFRRLLVATRCSALEASSIRHLAALRGHYRYCELVPGG